MNRSTDNLDSIANYIRHNFSNKDTAREKVLPICREVIRYCSNAIRSVHRQDFSQAEVLLQSARDLLEEAEKSVGVYTELNYTGFTRDAQKEFAEGCITLALVTGKSLPTPDELGINAAAYLNGMGEAVGELRRYLLDSMRRGDLSQGEELLLDMSDIYDILVT
ncbi:haloacid dehalogenase, partial [Chloroflexota bacterium]